jgi:hypothetical protein
MKTENSCNDGTFSSPRFKIFPQICIISAKILILKSDQLKKYIFPAILILSRLASPCQEVQFSPSVISSGGSSNSTNSVNFSRWRIGQINVVILPSENTLKQASVINANPLPLESAKEWSVSIYPNPVNTLLKVHFEMESQGVFTLEIFDVSGRKLITENALIIFPGQVVEIDLSGLIPALYLLKVIPSAMNAQKLFKILKQ